MHKWCPQWREMILPVGSASAFLLVGTRQQSRGKQGSDCSDQGQLLTSLVAPLRTMTALPHISVVRYRTTARETDCATTMDMVLYCLRVSPSIKVAH